MSESDFPPAVDDAFSILEAGRAMEAKSVFDNWLAEIKEGDEDCLWCEILFATRLVEQG